MNIKTKIRNVGRKVLYYFRCFKWYFFLVFTKMKPRKHNYVLSEEWYQKGKVLLIAPHADDELLSSYTLIKRCPNISIYYCGFTGSNQTEENRKIRYNEIEALCKKCNVPMIYGEGDCKNLAKTIGDYDTLIIPSIVDWHPEHRKVSYLLYNILQGNNKQFNIITYSVTVPNESCNRVLAVPMTKKEQNEKYTLFYRFYHSQSFMPIYRFRINERINGYHVKVYSSELFLECPYEKWLVETNYIMEMEQSDNRNLMSLIKAVGNTGDMKAIRLASTNFYTFMDNGEL